MFSENERWQNGIEHLSAMVKNFTQKIVAENETKQMNQHMKEMFEQAKAQHQMKELVEQFTTQYALGASSSSTYKASLTHFQSMHHMPFFKCY